MQTRMGNVPSTQVLLGQKEKNEIKWQLRLLELICNNGGGWI
jgi:hypothetical protein